MRRLVLAAILVASTCCAQQAVRNLPQAQARNQSQAGAAAPSGTITIAAGTQIPLTLASPITGKARKGDPVRAAVAFPVTVGNQVAIPVGAYVQGVITQIVKRSRSGPSVQMQFSTLVYANGYTVTLSGNNLQANLTETRDSVPAAATGADTSMMGTGKYRLAAPSTATNDQQTAEASSTDPNGYALAGHGARAAQTSPTLMPPPNPGPNKGAIIGLAVGGAAAVIVSAMVLGHQSGSAGHGEILFDTGWQFNMVLNHPLTVNAASTTTAS